MGAEFHKGESQTESWHLGKKGATRGCGDPSKARAVWAVRRLPVTPLTCKQITHQALIYPQQRQPLPGAVTKLDCLGSARLVVYGGIIGRLH